jgi:hypothetical protein
VESWILDLFDQAARLDGFKNWADFCRWDVGDAIFEESTMVSGLFVIWYAVVILLRIIGLPFRLTVKAFVNRIRS